MSEELRGMERRVFELERQVASLTTLAKVTEAHVIGMVNTMESRHKAFERGQDLILDRLKPLGLLAEMKIEDRVKDLETVRQQMTGALRLVAILGVLGIMGGIVGLVRMIKGV